MATAQVILLLVCLMQLVMGVDVNDMMNDAMNNMNNINVNDMINDAKDNINDFGNIDVDDVFDNAQDSFNDLVNQIGDIDFGSLPDDMKNTINSALDNMQTFSEDQRKQIKAGIDDGSFDVSALDGYSAEQKAEITKVLALNTQDSGENGDKIDDHGHDHSDGHDHDNSSLHVGASAAALSLVVVWNIMV